MKEESALFKYELAIVAILKNEAPYIKEWIDYHILAGVEHFYLYDNESEDNIKDVLQPYITKGIVDYTFYPGKATQIEVYYKSIQKYKFACRYMALLDADEFILPIEPHKVGHKTIKDVLHEVLDDKPFMVSLAINWHLFGSSGHEKADFTKGVLERFKYRAENKFGAERHFDNAHIKTIANPRCVDLMFYPHHCNYFLGMYACDENGKIVAGYFNDDVPSNKIIINHYFTKSKDEFVRKISRGNADSVLNTYKMNNFERIDKVSTVYDDSILKYRDLRQKNYIEQIEDSMTIDRRRFNMVFNILAPIAIFADVSPALLSIAPKHFFADRIHVFMTCLSVIRELKSKALSENDANYFEELLLKCIHASFLLGNTNVWQVQLLLTELPQILKLKYPIVQEIKNACIEFLPQMMKFKRLRSEWADYRYFDCIFRFLKNE